MKIVVIGGTGLIGSKTVAILRQGGHEVIAGSPKIGVNSITGAGLKEAMAGAQVVIDLTNSPSFEDRAVLEFFETSGRNLLTVEAPAGVRHHVALSIVGIDRTDNGYFRGKVAQEKLIVASGIPYTIIRATPKLNIGAAGSLSTRWCRWARRVLAGSVWTSGFGAHLLGADPACASRRIGLHETHFLFGACRHPVVWQRTCGCADVEERQGDPRLPARAAERFWQEHQGRARRIRPGWLLALSFPSQVRVHLRDGA